jgi:flagellin
MRSNLASLQSTGTALASTQLDLATGNKVNSALDNPVNYFAAQSLNHRASQLSSLLDGMGQAVQAIQATNNAITSITGLVNSLTSITNSATQDLQNITTVNSLETSSDNTSATSGLGSASVNNLTSGADNPSGTAITALQTLTLNAGTATGTFTIAANESLNTLVNQINGVSGFSASIVYGNGTTVSDGTSTSSDSQLVGQAYLRITSSNGQSITASDDNSGSVLAALGIGATSTTVQSGSDSADTKDYNAVLTQINALVSNANYQSTNLIDGNANDLTVQVNELSTNAITVSNADLTTGGNSKTPGSTGLGLGTAGSQSLATSAEIASAVTAVNAALSTLQSTASGFANSLSLIQNRQDFTTNLVNTLQNGASSLTIADKNEEGANLLALQTQQQLGIEALSLSSQANQSVLRLFS